MAYKTSSAVDIYRISQNLSLYWKRLFEPVVFCQAELHYQCIFEKIFKSICFKNFIMIVHILAHVELLP